MITVKQFYFNDLRECCYVLSDESKECVIVDPGISTKREGERLQQYIAENNLKPVKLLCTHGHFDHVMGNRFVTDTWNIPTYIHPADKNILKMAKATSQLFDIHIEDPSLDTVDINGGDEIKFGNSSLKVISTPGHTWGSVLFYSSPDKICITGDTLFAGSCGRTDLPEGDSKAMCSSLVDIIVRQIPHDTKIYPGHGPESTMVEELAHNPYLRKSTWLRFDV
ncbi:MAG: MBL fold metallo-hydrolase [Bacteroidales bacterium]|nr:MBL fold metallo-hydrolase [Bacteroidales bacterium]